MKYIVIIHYPVTSINYARGFANAADALAFATEARGFAEKDLADLKALGYDGNPRLITIHEACHLMTQPITIFDDKTDAEMQTRVEEEQTIKGA